MIEKDKILILLYRRQDQPLCQIDIETHFARINPGVTGIFQRGWLNVSKAG